METVKLSESAEQGLFALSISESDEEPPTKYGALHLYASLFNHRQFELVYRWEVSETLDLDHRGGPALAVDSGGELTHVGKEILRDLQEPRFVLRPVIFVVNRSGVAHDPGVVLPLSDGSDSGLEKLALHPQIQFQVTYCDLKLVEGEFDYGRTIKAGFGLEKRDDLGPWHQGECDLVERFVRPLPSLPDYALTGQQLSL